MKKYADLKRKPLEFDVGDKVLLKLTPQIWKKITGRLAQRGLIPRYDGPFEVREKVGAVAYRLILPERMKLHPTFHVSYLRPYYEDKEDPARNKTQRAPPMVRKQFDDDIVRIMDHRRLGQHRKNRRTEFLVKWAKNEEVSWEKDTDLWQYEDKVQDYLTSISTRASDSLGVVCHSPRREGAPTKTLLGYRQHAWAEADSAAVRNGCVRTSATCSARLQTWIEGCPRHVVAQQSWQRGLN
jgi:hypothetical protein